MSKAIFFKKDGDTITFCIGEEHTEPEYNQIVNMSAVTFCNMCNMLGYTTAPCIPTTYINMWHGVQSNPTIVESVKR